MILGIRTDKPESELYLINEHHIVDTLMWHAHRELSDTLHLKIDKLIARNSLALRDVAGIVVYQGPGSFTGLRIGISVANALAYTLNVPIAGGLEDGWQQQALRSIESLKTYEMSVVPLYGSEAHITTPRK